MKNFIKYTVLSFALMFIALSCEDQNIPERVNIQHPSDQSDFPRDNEYYRQLREYKKTDHTLAFGWYGSWTAVGASYQSRLVSAPDSMDIISIWSQWHSLTPQQMADKEVVQKIKGTKVTYTIFSNDLPEPFLVDGQITDEGIEAYAKAYCLDSMNKYSYDGIDIDYEPGFGAVGPFVGHNNELFKKLILAMGKYVGPKSGTGRLFIIDGVPFAVHTEVAEYFDYGIVQAYNSYGNSDLQTRFNNAFNKGWKPEQYIFTENFEAHWKTGGVNFDGKMPSLFGMALFNPTQGKSGGFGSYHIEYEYGHSDMPYKFTRKAIQLANPSPVGDFTKNLVSISDYKSIPHYNIEVSPSGHLFGEVKCNVSARLWKETTTALDVDLKVDNSLVVRYNGQMGTEYKTIDASMIMFSAPLHFVEGTQEAEMPIVVSVDGLASLDEGEYMIAVCPDVQGSQSVSINEREYIKYITITKQLKQIQVSITGATQTASLNIMSLIDGEVAGSTSYSIPSINLSQTSISDLTVDFVVDASLVKLYNSTYGTSHSALAADNIQIEGEFAVAIGSTSSTGAAVKCSVIDPSLLEMGGSLIALRPTFGDNEDYAASSVAGVQYILVYKGEQNILPLQKLEEFRNNSSLVDNLGNKLDWAFGIRNLSSVGGSGVWNYDDKVDLMFDGKDAATGYWHAIFGNYWSWNGTSGGELTLDMKGQYNVSTLLWWTYASNSNHGVRLLKSVMTSVDGTNWVTHNSGDVEITRGTDRQQWISFIKPVEAKYIRLVVTGGFSDYCGMCEMEVWTSNN